jgi:hypothetical protein
MLISFVHVTSQKETFFFAESYRYLNKTFVALRRRVIANQLRCLFLFPCRLEILSIINYRSQVHASSSAQEVHNVASKLEILVAGFYYLFHDFN